MAPFRQGVLIAADHVLQRPDGRPGATFTFRATMRTTEGVETVAVKTVAGRRLVNELAAAWVAEKHSPGMAPYTWLVDDPDGLLPSIAGEPLSGGAKGHWLATTFSDLPAYKPPSDLSGLEGLAGNLAFRRMMVFDILIANTDRVNRNILQRGDEVCAFDHEKAFFGESWDACALHRHIDATPISPFEDCLNYARADDKNRMRSLATKWADTISAVDIKELDALLDLDAIGEIDIRALQRFIVERSTNLPALVDVVLNRP